MTTDKRKAHTPAVYMHLFPFWTPYLYPALFTLWCVMFHE